MMLMKNISNSFLNEFSYILFINQLKRPRPFYSNKQEKERESERFKAEDGNNKRKNSLREREKTNNSKSRTFIFPAEPALHITTLSHRHAQRTNIRRTPAYSARLIKFPFKNAWAP